jgi:uncharacterized protein (TIGR00730 family)
LPGGVGTLEELFESWTWLQLGYHTKPIGLLNVAGYFDSLLAFMRHTVAQGFLAQGQLDTLAVSADVSALLNSLAGQARTTSGAPDYSDI